MRERDKRFEFSFLILYTITTEQNEKLFITNNICKTTTTTLKSDKILFSNNEKLKYLNTQRETRLKTTLKLKKINRKDSKKQQQQPETLRHN